VHPFIYEQEAFLAHVRCPREALLVVQVSLYQTLRGDVELPGVHRVEHRGFPARDHLAGRETTRPQVHV
jgi:hypothetical protein